MIASIRTKLRRVRALGECAVLEEPSSSQVRLLGTPLQALFPDPTNGVGVHAFLKSPKAPAGLDSFLSGQRLNGQHRPEEGL